MGDRLTILDVLEPKQTGKHTRTPALPLEIGGTHYQATEEQEEKHVLGLVGYILDRFWRRETGEQEVMGNSGD